MRPIRAKRCFLSVWFQRGLCCFPGFSHSGSSSRKGKIPQPLLASVNPSGFIGGRNAEAHEMVLLEKQGLCSQAQRGGERCASLPPSSLPRPQRAKGKKVGDYGRLSDGKSNGTEDSDRKSRQGSPLVPRAYVRLSDDSENKHSSTDSGVESTSKGSPTSCLVPPPRSYSRLADQDSVRTSPVKSIVSNLTSRAYSRLDEPQQRNYTRLSDSDNEKPPTPPIPTEKRDSPSRKVGQYSRLEKPEKSPPKDNKKESLLPIPNFSKIPTRSYLPPPRKFSDYSVFEQQKNTEPKIGLLARRGSLQRDQQPQTTRSSPPVRSLPATNKYRIQF